MAITMILGQAPPAVKQSVPYDTTMLYDWLELVGISKEDAQKQFIFEAVYDKFPGYDDKGGHKKPTFVQFKEYWSRSLEDTFNSCDKVIVLGAVAFNMLRLHFDVNMNKDFCECGNLNGKPFLYLPHPSKRNALLAKTLNTKIKSSLDEFLRKLP